VYASGRGGGAPIGVGEDNREAPLPVGRGNDVDARAEATTLRTSGRQGGSGGGAPEAGEDGEEADARIMGIRSPRGRGRSGRKPPAFWGPTARDRRRGGGRGRRRVGGRRISGSRQRRRIPWCRGRGTPQNAVVGEDDGGGGGGGHDNNDGGGPGTKKLLSAGGGGLLLLYIDTPLVPGRVTKRDKRGAFCHGW
jgi:hypothetical protein